jgi:putative photosynthetic complex assembly protein 2
MTLDTVAALAVPLAFTLFVWWFSTGVILILDQRPAATYAITFLWTTLVAIIALFGIVLTRDSATVAGAYVAFTCAIVVWGWQEMAFLMGYVTGPRAAPCPPDCTETARFKFAVQAVLYHELALLVAACTIALLTANHVNHVATSTFVVLLLMRLSAKLNLFFGVRNVYEKFLPEHLRYLGTYFKRRAMNLLFPISITLSSFVAAQLWSGALAAGAREFEIVSGALIASLLSLAVLEHWLLVLPVPVEAAWNWALNARHRRAGKELPPVRESVPSSPPSPAN